MDLSSLRDICRCCHSEGSFKSLKEPYTFRGKVEVYYQMLIETFGTLISPLAIEGSFTICDDCIEKLRDSTKFKNQVEFCEKKFNQYSELLQEPQLQNHNDFDVVELKMENNYFENVNNEFENRDDDLNNVNLENAVDPLKKDSTKPKNKNLFGCYVCPKKYISKELLKIHIKKHMTKKYKCNDCGKSFKRLTRLKKHSRTIHLKPITLNENLNTDTDKNGVQNVKLFNYLECRFCKKQVREHFYERHLKIHVGKTECITCCEIFDSIELLNEHSKIHKYENMYTCDFCKKQFIRRSTLKRHIDLHHMGTGRQFMCHECGVFFNDITNLRAHTTNVHQKLRMFECSICQKKLASKKTLKVHIRTHTGERPYVCDECGDGFICFTKLKIHKIKHNIMKKEGTKYVCKICHTTFNGQGLLTHHVRSEHPRSLAIDVHKYNRKYLPCPSCKKVFCQKFSLDRHMMKHGVTVKVPCVICNKMLTDKFSLARHIKNMHTAKEKVIKEKVQCHLCKRKVYDIENHMTVHTVRPMKCETCGKKYPDAAILHRHIMNVHHDVNKIFQCNKCDRRPYSRKEHLRSHMLKNHGYEPKADEE